MSESDQRAALPPRASQGHVLGVEEEEPPGSPKRWPCWKDVPDELWNDWRWQSQNAIRSVRQLRRFLSFTDEEISALEALETEYKLAIPPYYASLIHPDDPHDPIRLQAVPSPRECENPSGYELEDPLEEDKDMPVPGLTHRYPDRALVVTTHVCTMYCRFCTRKRATMVRGGWDAISRDDERMIEYIREHPEIRDVILSGGDPLTLPLPRLRFFVESVAAIPHVDVVRIGTRVPVTLPMRLYDQELVDLLASAEKVWIQTHFNHPREITPEAARVCKTLLRAGMPVNNHTVLLKGVNDSLETMRSLMRALLRIKVRPYYLFHCDPVMGAGHFRTSIWKGLEIMEGLRGHMSGLGIPTYVVDSPHGGGKIPLMPNYLVSASDDSVVLRNYEGMLIRYQAEDKPATIKPTATRGVSLLLQGTKTALVPENTERMKRRRLIVLANKAKANESCDSSRPAALASGVPPVPPSEPTGLPDKEPVVVAVAAAVATKAATRRRKKVSGG
ncbi:MAG: KamA family radical SAM protein [Gemmatales bacterium]|nr:KamA family radical SAM protein [Gemmatales bacterium]MDW8387661.1 KamA family radical SAM protein [Gemmatales bacterium]